MFIKSAGFYDALYHFLDYEKASQKLHAIIQEKDPDARTLLDVGCGTGKHLEYLSMFYLAEGLDVSTELLEIARKRLPNIPLHSADMTAFNLDKSFDVVTCLFSSIAYVKSVDNLYRSIKQMANHLNPGGTMIVEPWISREQYRKGRITANYVDQPDLKIAWMYTSEIEDNISVFDIHYLVGTPDEVTHFTEKHEMGLFSTEEYVDAFHRAGIQIEYDQEGLFNRGLYFGRKTRFLR